MNLSGTLIVISLCWTIQLWLPVLSGLTSRAAEKDLHTMAEMSAKLECDVQMFYHPIIWQVNHYWNLTQWFTLWASPKITLLGRTNPLTMAPHTATQAINALPVLGLQAGVISSPHSYYITFPPPVMKYHVTHTEQHTLLFYIIIFITYNNYIIQILIRWANNYSGAEWQL